MVRDYSRGVVFGRQVMLPAMLCPFEKGFGSHVFLISVLPLGIVVRVDAQCLVHEFQVIEAELHHQFMCTQHMSWGNLIIGLLLDLSGHFVPFSSSY